MNPYRNKLYHLLAALLSLIPVLSALAIPDLTYSSKPGQITITYQGSEPYAIGQLTLSFNLIQEGGVPNWWGSPYLNWQSVSQSSASAYKFTNQVNLDNDLLNPGQVIIFQYNPNPWNSNYAPTEVELTTVKQIPVEVSVQIDADNSLNYQKTITISNTLSTPLDTRGSVLTFDYVGAAISSAWGNPWVAWTIQNVGTSYTFTASRASYMPIVASQDKLTIIFSGAGIVSNVKLATLQVVDDDDDSSEEGDEEENEEDTEEEEDDEDTEEEEEEDNEGTGEEEEDNEDTTEEEEEDDEDTEEEEEENDEDTEEEEEDNEDTEEEEDGNGDDDSSNNSTNTTSSSKLFAGYFESWSEIWHFQGESLTLAKLPSYVNIVNIAFMKPDSQYYGLLDLSYTGLEFSAAGPVVRDAIAALKYQNPNTKVLVSVGGATYTNWASLNPTAIAKVVQELGLDGVDIDYEPSQPGCQVTSGKVSCTSDSQYQSIVSQLRAALPRPYVISIAAFSVGAYGEGSYASSQPSSAYTGVAVNLLRSQYAASIDFINVMGYDASSVYSPTEAYHAYKSYFSGPVLIGVEVPPESWGGHVLTLTELNSLTSFVNQNDGAGMMIWSLQKKPSGTASSSNPSADMISQGICSSFNLGNCTQSLGL